MAVTGADDTEILQGQPSVRSRPVRMKHPIHRWVSYGSITADFQHFVPPPMKFKEPNSYKKAAKYEKRVEGMRKEIQAMKINDAWDKNIVGSERYTK